MEATNQNPKILLLDEPDGGKYLAISLTSYIEDIFLDENCPTYIKNVIDDSFSWQQRCKTNVRESMILRTLDPRWLALLLVLDTLTVWEQKPVSILAEDINKLSNKGGVSQIRIPLSRAGWTMGESHVSLTPKDQPVVGAFAAVGRENGKITKINLALSGVSPSRVVLSTSTAVLVGKELNSMNIQNLASSVFDEIDPPEDYRGSKEYRREMARVTTTRALEECRIGGQPL